jgi:hypothetical protein
VEFKKVEIKEIKELLLAEDVRQGRYKAPDLSQAKPIYEDRFQDPASGWGMHPSKVALGIVAENSPKGVRVAAVAKDSPAANAKLEKGDILLSLDGKDLKKANDLPVRLKTREPGDKIKLAYQRGDKKGVVEITLAPRQAPDTKKQGSLGIEVDPSDDGPVLTEVVEKGAADKAGLKIGDVLLSLDGVNLGSNEVLLETLASKKIGDQVKIVYLRGKEKKEATPTLEPAPLGATSNAEINGWDYGYQGGRYFIAVPQGWLFQNGPAKPVGDACEVVGRTTGAPASSWALKFRDTAHQHYLEFHLNGQQELRIDAVEKYDAKQKTRLLKIGHPAIKPGAEFNKLLVIARGQSYEVYVNGILVCDPLVTDFLALPVSFALVATAGPAASRAEFERITVWSAAGLPKLALSAEGARR